MYKKILMLVFTMVLVFGLSLNAYAAETVTFTSNSKLIYQNENENTEKIYLGDEFIGMAPGETKEQIIIIKNDNEQTAKFYVSANAIRTIEERVYSYMEGNSAENGLISFSLRVNNNYPFYDKKTFVPKNNKYLNFNELIKDLDDDTYIATLKKGESINLIISVGLDGKTIENVEENDYSNAKGTIEFDFSVSYDTPTNEVVVDKQTENTSLTVFNTKVANTIAAIKTRDTTPIFALSAILVIGIILLFLTGKKKKSLEDIS